MLRAAGSLSPEPEGSDRWIHRDKLALIELQEYKDRGIQPPAQLLARITNGKQRAAQKDSQANQSFESDSYASNQRQLLTPESETGLDDDYETNGHAYEHEHDYPDEVEDDDQYVPEDPRSAEEIAAERDGELRSRSDGQTHRLRSSSSRIPLATSSPLPIHPEYVGRSTPLPRKRGASQSLQPDNLMIGRARSRSNSLHSQDVLGNGHIRPIEESPIKSVKSYGSLPSVPKPIGKSTPQSAKQAQGNVAQSRSASAARPRTANAPKGEPPWLADMWKVDPYLHPDQQIVPTHAKRMAQEQWEKDGTPGSIYDKNFVPVKPHMEMKQPTQPQLSPVKAIQQPHSDEDWPLKTPSGPTSPISPPLSGGFSTIPRDPLAEASRRGSAKNSARSSKVPFNNTPSGLNPGAAPGPNSNLQDQAQNNPKEDSNAQEKESQKQKRGCGCCVLM